ncbi:MAG TPA: FtsK/SpoIIIE domain-containing protein [Plantibacter sp.]|uniref:FtsK/SpoIIIE domain-containing protein n=1 Tax=Plantibacter sp. TaxID=1871045 RepID=UPI002BF70811|nr:FtsK/SpoIIIE domain-containing protein [Plantibacter sp.]
MIAPDIEPSPAGSMHRPPRTRRLQAPRAPVDPPAGSMPILASIAPVVASCALFAITGSPVTLVFAALGPLIAIAGFIDSRWAKRRRGRREQAAYRLAVDRIGEQILAAHDEERHDLETLHPAGRALQLLTGADRHRWRLPDERRTLVVLGRGVRRSTLRIDGADEDPRWSAAERLSDAPVVVDASEGIGIVGGTVLARSVGRSVVLQLARQLQPAAAAFIGGCGAHDDDANADGWHMLGRLPHRDGTTAADEPDFAQDDGMTLVSIVERWSASSVARHHAVLRASPGGVLIALSDTVESIPTRCRHLLVLGADGDAFLADGTGGVPAMELAPTLLADAEAEQIADGLTEAALTMGESPAQSRLVTTVDAAEMRAGDDRRRQGSGLWQPDALRVSVGIGTQRPLQLDLGADGPHALVGGTTGSGKSELLITWITALAAQCSPAELSFLLIDCKGGASFQAVERLPHVVGMVTDLEPAAADRVVSSLRAELRHRERVLARHGARHLLDPELAPEHRPARLVVVVDEFQALLDASPHLHQVFADLASRGRSLGLHLILCSQRPAAVAADAILANCTLRLSLRVTSRQDSTAILGVPDAAALPAGAVGRCIVWNGERPTVFQVAMTGPEDLVAVRHRWRSASSPRRPWLDPLPESLPLESLRALHLDPQTPPEEARSRPSSATGIVFGLMDLPEQQTQLPAVWNPAEHGSLLVLGAARTGRSTLLDTLAVQAQPDWRVERVRHDPEQAWDTIIALSDPTTSAEPTLLLIDDVESMLATAGDEHGAALRDAVLGLLRDGGRRGVRVVLVASRLGGVIHRFSAQTDRTLILRLADRQEHLVAGAPAACFDQRRPAGRAYWDDAEVQIALPEASSCDETVARDVTHRWAPAPGSTTVLVTRAPRAAHSLLQHLGSSGRRVRILDPLTGSPMLPISGGFRSPELDPDGSDGDTATVIVVDPEHWLSGRMVAGRDMPSSAARADLILHACSASDFRQITRSRELPPLLGYGSARAWWWRAGREAERVDLGRGAGSVDSREPPRGVRPP